MCGKIGDYQEPISYSIRSCEYIVYENIFKMALSNGLLLRKNENLNQYNEINNCP